MHLTDINGAMLEVAWWQPPPPVRDLAPIVLLHEGLGSVAMWRDWPAGLAAATGRRVMAYSRRGYGQSGVIPDVRGAGRHRPDYMHREALGVLPALLATLGLQAPVLLGHSDGGSIALLFASAHPVTACVVMAPHVLVEDVSVAAITEARTQFVQGGLRAPLARYHADVDCAFWQWNDIWLDPAFRPFDIRPECARIQAPLLAIQGKNDPYGSMQQIDDIARVAPHARLCKLADCGHAPHRDQPAAVLAALLPFLATLP